MSSFIFFREGREVKLYELENVRRVRGDRTVLHIDSLEIEPHKIYTLIGPNGAGKTSLLKILSFLDQPTAGQIRFQGRDIDFTEKSLLSLRRQVVLFDQNPIMLTGTVSSNIEFGLKVRKLSKQERQKRIDEALEMVGMERFMDYDAQSLSGGETKRVALARALALYPDVLLCDEPTANVDGENQEIILEILTRVKKERQTSVIFSTHYLSQSRRLADHTLLLQNGRLSGMTNENIFRLTVVRREGEFSLCQLTGQVTLRLPSKSLPEKGETMKIHIDPAKIVCNPQQGQRAGNYFQAHITELCQDKGKVRIKVDIGVRLFLLLPMARYLDFKPTLGEKISIFIPYDCVEITALDF